MQRQQKLMSLEDCAASILVDSQSMEGIQVLNPLFDTSVQVTNTRDNIKTPIVASCY